MTLPPYTIGLQLSFARMEKDLDEEFEELLGSKVPIPNEGDRLTRFRDSKMAARWQNNTFPRLRCKGDAVPLGKKKNEGSSLDPSGRVARHQWRIRNGPWPVSSDHDEHGWIVKRRLRGRRLRRCGGGKMDDTFEKMEWKMVTAVDFCYYYCCC